MATILLTDGEQRSTLAAARSLGRAGHDVLVCSVEGHPLAGASRFTRASFVVPDPASLPEAFVEAVGSIVSVEHVGVLLPMTDVSAPLLLPLRENHLGLAIPFPESQVLDRASDKRLLLETAKRLGIPVPNQTVVHSRAETGTAEGSTLPAVLKPTRSAVLGSEGVEKFGVRMVDGAEDLTVGLDEYPDEAYPILVQERIVGPGLGAFILADGGRPIAMFGHRRIREKPPSGGVSVYRESVTLRDDVRDYAERLMGELSWTGVAMVEFKEESETGIPYLMEVNGRFWGSLQLAIDAGVDFPNLLVRAAMGEQVPPVAGYRAGIRSRWLWGDFDHLLSVVRSPRGYRDSYPELPSRMGALGRFLIPWRPGDRFEVLRLGDPRPFARESWQWFASLGR